jgi:hypothetical protein
MVKWSVNIRNFQLKVDFLLRLRVWSHDSAPAIARPSWSVILNRFLGQLRRSLLLNYLGK